MVNSVIAYYRPKLELELSKLEGWSLVLCAVLLVLAAVYVIGMGIWCAINGHGSFTGRYSWNSLWSFNVQCTW